MAVKSTGGNTHGCTTQLPLYTSQGSTRSASNYVWSGRLYTSKLPRHFKSILVRMLWLFMYVAGTLQSAMSVCVLWLKNIFAVSSSVVMVSEFCNLVGVSRCFDSTAVSDGVSGSLTSHRICACITRNLPFTNIIYPNYIGRCQKHNSKDTDCFVTVWSINIFRAK